MMPHCLPQKHSHQLQENKKHETRRKESEQAASHLPRQPRRTIVQRNGGTTIHAIGHRGLVLNRKMRHQRKGSRATIRSAGGWGVWRGEYSNNVGRCWRKVLSFVISSSSVRRCSCVMYPLTHHLKRRMLGYFICRKL